MKKGNEFFASVFTRELNKWKKEKHLSQEKFAEAIGVEPNMISRYKKGESHPTDDRLDSICKVLCVDSSIFFPQTLEEKYCNDPQYRDAVHKIIDHEEARTLATTKITPSFWEFLWRYIPCMEAVFPLSADKASYRITRRCGDEFNLLYADDIAFIEELQKDTINYISVQILKKGLSTAFENYDPSTLDFEKYLDRVLTGMGQDVLRCARKEAVNGNDRKIAR